MDRKEQLKRAIGSRLRGLRDAAEMTQAELAEHSEIATESYGRLERGVCFPSIPTLLRLSDALQVTVDQILGRQPLSEPTDQRPPQLRRLLEQLQRLDDERQREVVQGLTLLIPPER